MTDDEVELRLLRNAKERNECAKRLLELCGDDSNEILRGRVAPHMATASAIGALLNYADSQAKADSAEQFHALAAVVGSIAALTEDPAATLGLLVKMAAVYAAVGDHRKKAQAARPAPVVN